MIKGTRFGIVCSLLLLGLVAFFGIGAEARRPQKPWSVAIQTFGRVDAVLIGLARQAIEESFNVRRVIELPPEELPVGAFYEPGKRYRAEKILAFLDDLILDTPTKIVGLICVDISTTKDHYEDWGIFGMSFISGQSCVVSTFRLGQGNVDQALFDSRVKKVIIHELGHAFGLPHCPTPTCVMGDAKGRISTVDGNECRFCEKCRKRLGDLGR